jgi:hypothetical protein
MATENAIEFTTLQLATVIGGADKRAHGQFVLNGGFEDCWGTGWSGDYGYKCASKDGTRYRADLADVVERYGTMVGTIRPGRITARVRHGKVIPVE